MLTFSSSNPETLELFRSVYYRPKIVLIILLFITFPSIDRNLHQSIQSEDSNLSHKSSYQLHQQEQSLSSSSNLLSSQQIKTTSNPQKTHASNQDRLHPLSCPDAYLDHRNNIICPHAPKRLKSVRQRFDEVLQEIKTSIKRWSNPQLIHQSSSHLNPQLIKLVTQTSTNGLTKSQNPNWKFRSMICTPTSSPFVHLIILLHTLFFIQALSLLIEDALIKDACSTTFIHSFRSSSSWSKLWSRVKFRFRNQWSKRSFWEPFIFWIVSIVIISTIAIETFGETGSWQTGAIWHDLPFRRICQTLNPLDSNHHHHHHQNLIHPSTSTSDSKMTEVRISIIGLQALKILSFFLDRAPFLKPARSLILIECGVALVCLCQPAQHFLPQKVLPKSIKIPNRILSRITNRPKRSLIEFNPLSENDRVFKNRHRSSAIETLRSRSNSMNANANHRQSPVVVEVETKWVLSVLVEACVCIAAISSYAVVMVHLPYTSYYWFPLILTITYVKVCVERLKNLYRSALHTIRCLESVLSRFSPEINKRGRDWKCSICFEDEERSDESDDSSKSPTLEEINQTSPIKLNHSGHGNGNQRGEKCVSLKCGHLYHAKCLVKWLHYQTFCPICHRSVHTTTTATTTTSDSSLNSDETFPHED